MKKEYKDIAARIHEETGIKYGTVWAIARRVFATVRDEMEKGNEVDIDEFGSFYFGDRKPRINTNVNGGPDTYTPAQKVIKFKPTHAWRWKTYFDSCVIPEEGIPEGTVLSARLAHSPELCAKAGQEYVPPIPWEERPH